MQFVYGEELNIELADTNIWLAKMIHPLADLGVEMPASFVYQNFNLSQIDGTEYLCISALGLYRCFINGQRVGHDVLTPGWTSYDKRLTYQTYSISSLLKLGENEIEIWLADGWYRSQIMWPIGEKSAIYNCWGNKIAAIAEIKNQHNSLILGTDSTWKSGALPITKSGIYFGEIYDANLEKLNCTHSVKVLDFDYDVLVNEKQSSVKEIDPFLPINHWTDEEKRIIYDFGQNLAGYVSFKVKGSQNSKIIIEHAEVLDKDKTFNNSNYRTAAARVEYTLKGDDDGENYRPHFTFFGYRYARISLIGEVEIVSIQSIPITSVIHSTGLLSTGNKLVNKLLSNTIWSQRANFIDVPTDCPQRDERLGWSGDAQVFANTACYLHNAHDFFRKWIKDVIVDQRDSGAIAFFSPDPTRLHEDEFPGRYGSTGWGDVICIVPWTLWLHYGDSDILKESLTAMTKWVDFVWSISNAPIVKPPRHPHTHGFTFGDWLQPSGTSRKPLPTIGDEAAATIYLYISADIAAKSAAVIGESEIENRMRMIAEQVKRAFAQEFISSSGRLVYDDQTSYALAILYDLIPEAQLAAARSYFVAAIERCDGKIGTGFIGTPALLPALTKIGEHKLAAKVFLQEELPGWLYQVKNGATTIWERWDAIQSDGTLFEPSMNSYNHYAYGAVCQWLFESLAGFRPDEKHSGFKTIIFEPVIIPELSPVVASYLSIAGEVKAKWKVDNSTVHYLIAIPDDSVGLLVLLPEYKNIRINGDTIKPTYMTSSNTITKSTFDLSAGTYEIFFNL